MLKVMRAVALVVGLVACGGGGVVTITLDPSSASLTVGQTARFTATVGGSPGSGVDWHATGGQLFAKDASATFVATEPGSFDITASSRLKPDVTAVVTVTVAPVPGTAHVRFVSDSSLIVAGAGTSATLEVEVVDADGSVIDGGQVTWSTSDPAIASVTAAGDRTATITTETASTSQAVITATYEELSADASVLVTDPHEGTVIIGSDLVLAKSATSLTLVRAPLTEGLTAGQRLVSGNRAGVLAEIVDVTVGSDTVSVTTQPTSLADAFDGFTFSGSVTPQEVTVQLVDGRYGVVTLPGAAGAVGTATVLDDVTCTGSGPGSVDLTGSDITVSASIYGELSFSVFMGDDHFLARFGATGQVSASTGSVAVSGPVSDAVCSLELPRIGLAPLSAGVMTLWTGFVPILGVSISASGAATSFAVGGPYGGIGATLEGGIEYTDESGWEPLFVADFDGDFEPFAASATVDGPFGVYLAPFGQIDIGLSIDLGVDALAVPIVDARFVELRGFGYLDLVMPAPIEPAAPTYDGPTWVLGIGARGALKAEFQGLLPELLAWIGIDVNFAGQLELFAEQVALLEEPSLSFTAVPGTINLADDLPDTVVLKAYGSDAIDGTVSFWVRKDGAPLTFLQSAAMVDGSATSAWLVTDEGEYELYARMNSDALSDVVPYAANNTALVSVTDEGPEDGGPLGNEGPFRGPATYISLGECNATGVALTLDLVEGPQGTLSGTYVGHHCTTPQGCSDIEPYPSGPLAGTVSGQRADDDVSFTLSDPVGGTFTGIRFVPEAPPGSSSLSVLQGQFVGMDPCEDSFGSHDMGLYSFVGTTPIDF